MRKERTFTRKTSESKARDNGLCCNDICKGGDVRRHYLPLQICFFGISERMTNAIFPSQICSESTKTLQKFKHFFKATFRDFIGTIKGLFLKLYLSDCENFRAELNETQWSEAKRLIKSVSVTGFDSFINFNHLIKSDEISLHLLLNHLNH